MSSEENTKMGGATNKINRTSKNHKKENIDPIAKLSEIVKKVKKI